MNNLSIQQISNILLKGGYIQANQMFAELNGCIPQKILIEQIDHEKLFENVIEKYKVIPDSVYKIESHNKNRREFRSIYVILEPGLNLFFNPGLHGNNKQMEILYNTTCTQEKIDELRNFILSFQKSENDYRRNRINIIVKKDYGLDTFEYELKDAEINIEDNYNDDFKDISERIINELNVPDSKGLFLFHGKPGCGKTSYIRHLCKTVKKKIIYLSPDLTSELSSPNFINFISDNENSILVIEDAENVLEERKAGQNAAIANLLNLTDGLLADCFKIQVVCSFNTPLSQIDHALLRKGRLNTRYEFKPLTAEKATALSFKLGFNHIYNQEATLAEIYNYTEPEFENSRKSIGFKNT